MALGSGLVQGSKGSKTKIILLHGMETIRLYGALRVTDALLQAKAQVAKEPPAVCACDPSHIAPGCTFPASGREQSIRVTRKCTEHPHSGSDQTSSELSVRISQHRWQGIWQCFVKPGSHHCPLQRSSRGSRRAWPRPWRRRAGLIAKVFRTSRSSFPGHWHECAQATRQTEQL